MGTARSSAHDKSLREVRRRLKTFEGVSGAVTTGSHLLAIEAHVRAIQIDARMGLGRAPEDFRCIAIAAHALAMIEHTDGSR